MTAPATEIHHRHELTLAPGFDLRGKAATLVGVVGALLVFVLARAHSGTVAVAGTVAAVRSQILIGAGFLCLAVGVVDLVGRGWGLLAAGGLLVLYEHLLNE